MGWLNFLKGPDFDQGLEQWRSMPGAVLLDVRTPEEYAQGRVPGSWNLPLPLLADQAKERIPNRETPVYVYCLSGARSRQAAGLLRRMGYASVTDLGGINRYHGKVER